MKAGPEKYRKGKVRKLKIKNNKIKKEQIRREVAQAKELEKISKTALEK